MKRALVLISLLTVLNGALRAADAVAIATQQEAEERNKRLAATVEELQTTVMAQQKTIAALASDLGKLREETAHNNQNAATQESLRKLNEQILKVDEARVADNKHIQEALEGMRQAIKKLAEVPPPTTGGRTRPVVNDPPANPGNSGAGARPQLPVNQEGFEYVIKPGDALSIIVQKYRREKIPVTAQSIKEANPGVDWDRLQIGKKIFIPKPK